MFRVRVRFLENLENLNWMKPNIEGTAKINIREERYVWIWTHKLVNWIRMKLWW